MAENYGDSYYEYDSLMVLEKHLSICSPFSSDARAIGHRIASLWGVAFFDLERLIEHRAGATIEAIRHLDGEEALVQLQLEALERTLRDRPFGVLVVAGETLTHPLALRRLQEETDLVSIDMSFEIYLKRFLNEFADRNDSDFDSHGQALQDWQALSRAASQASHQVPWSPNLAAMSQEVLGAVPSLRPS